MKWLLNESIVWDEEENPIGFRRLQESLYSALCFKTEHHGEPYKKMARALLQLNEPFLESLDEVVPGVREQLENWDMYKYNPRDPKMTFLRQMTYEDQTGVENRIEQFREQQRKKLPRILIFGMRWASLAGRIIRRCKEEMADTLQGFREAVPTAKATFNLGFEEGIDRASRQCDQIEAQLQNPVTFPFRDASWDPAGVQFVKDSINVLRNEIHAAGSSLKSRKLQANLNAEAKAEFDFREKHYKKEAKKQRKEEKDRLTKELKELKALLEGAAELSEEEWCKGMAKWQKVEVDLMFGEIIKTTPEFNMGQSFKNEQTRRFRLEYPLPGQGEGAGDHQGAAPPPEHGGSGGGNEGALRVHLKLTSIVTGYIAFVAMWGYLSHPSGVPVEEDHWALLAVAPGLGMLPLPAALPALLGYGGAVLFFFISASTDTAESFMLGLVMCGVGVRCRQYFDARNMKRLGYEGPLGYGARLTYTARRLLGQQP